MNIWRWILFSGLLFGGIPSVKLSKSPQSLNPVTACVFYMMGVHIQRHCVVFPRSLLTVVSSWEHVVRYRSGQSGSLRTCNKLTHVRAGVWSRNTPSLLIHEALRLLVIAADLVESHFPGFPAQLTIKSDLLPFLKVLWFGDDHSKHD